MENPFPDEVQEHLTEILRAIQKIQYGSVEITIHSSKIVQIETREKRRFEKRTSRE